MTILYVTSFNEKFFECTGKAMVESFTDQQVNGDLLITRDGLETKDYQMWLEGIRSKRRGALEIGHNVYDYCLDYDPMLHVWVEDNASIIPKVHGGLYTQKNCDDKGCPGKIGEWKGHFKNCPGGGWNYRAAGWFRKIVSLNHALHLGQQYRAIIFVDSDTLFTRTLAPSYVYNVFGGYDMFYHRGPVRTAKKTSIESGFIGWHEGCGYDLLQRVINEFTSGEFRQYPRWDDGYVFWRVVDKYQGAYKVKDIAGKEATLDTLEHGPFAEYVTHNKGTHMREGLT